MHLLALCACWKTAHSRQAVVVSHPVKLGLDSLNGQPPKSAIRLGGQVTQVHHRETWSPGPPTPLGSLNEQASVGDLPRSLLGAISTRLGKGVNKRVSPRLGSPKPSLGLTWKVVLEVISRNLPHCGLRFLAGLPVPQRGSVCVEPGRPNLVATMLENSSRSGVSRGHSRSREQSRSPRRQDPAVSPIAIDDPPREGEAVRGRLSCPPRAHAANGL